MYKACSRCGKVHNVNYKCNIGRVRGNIPEDARLRNLNAWHIKAEEIKKKSNYLCSVCKEEGRYNYNNLETHHIDKLRDKPEKLLDDYNLICLCVEHHKLADRNKIDKEYLFKLAREREDSYI